MSNQGAICEILTLRRASSADPYTALFQNETRERPFTVVQDAPKDHPRREDCGAVTRCAAGRLVSRNIGREIRADTETVS